MNNKNLLPYLSTAIEALQAMRDEMKNISESPADELSHLKELHDALGVKLASYERHLDLKHEDDIYDAVNEMRADETVRKNLTAEYMRNNTPPTGGTFPSESSPIIGGPKSYYEPKVTSARDWEVVEFKGYYKGTKGMWHLDDDPSYNPFTYESLTREATIHRVRRLSDGVEFEVGEVAGYTASAATGEIVEFMIEGNIMSARFAAFWYDINLLVKLEKKPLFTTADGVNIYDQQTEFYGFNSMNVYSWKLSDGSLPADRQYFSTREAAETAYNRWLSLQRVLCLHDLEGDWCPPEYFKTMEALVKGRVSNG